MYLVKRRPYAALARDAAVAAGRKRPVISAFCALLFILGPLEKGGSIAPLSFTGQLMLSQMENRYSWLSLLILDLPTALIQVLFSTHENL
jgi:hypothetical protein